MTRFGAEPTGICQKADNKLADEPGGKYNGFKPIFDLWNLIREGENGELACLGFALQQTARGILHKGQILFTLRTLQEMLAAELEELCSESILAAGLRIMGQPLH